MASQGRGARAKGSGYELKIAKKLSPIWGGTFARTPGSGSLHWGSDQRVAGDIIAPPEVDFPFVVECKKHEGWIMDHVILDSGDPRKWWAQVVTDARRVHKVPMLIFSRNRAKDFIMIPYDDSLYESLTLGATDSARTFVTIENIRGESQRFDVIVTTFDSLFIIDTAFLREYATRVRETWDPYADEYKE
jgi:hypothetical protein